MSTVRELRKKAEKRDRLGSLKKGLEQVNAKGSLLESLEFEEDDVFDVLDEDQYEKLVESRRNGTDFVVDDGNSILCPRLFTYFYISHHRFLFTRQRAMAIMTMERSISESSKTNMIVRLFTPTRIA